MSSPLSETFARLVGRPFADDAPDRDLIARFHQDRDEAAFAALVRRHGPMVQRVCRWALGDPYAADYSGTGRVGEGAKAMNLVGRP